MWGVVVVCLFVVEVLFCLFFWGVCVGFVGGGGGVYFPGRL